MPVAVALLRGVNVGGRNKVPMADLRSVLSGAGYADVATYIASGNIVFRHGGLVAPALAADVERLIREHLGVRCRALVLPADRAQAIAAAIPPQWENGPTMKADVIYLLDGAEPSDLVDALRPRSGIDTVLAAPGAVLWMVPRDSVNRSSLRNLVGSPWYGRATVRNVNTARRVAELATALDASQSAGGPEARRVGAAAVGSR